MNTYSIEVTDTFGGEPNYSWVRRFNYEAKSIRGAINKLARECGPGWRKVYGDSYDARYDAQNATICAFVSEWSSDELKP